MKIKQAIDRIPGGLMLVPLLLGACVHTFAPHAGKYLGSFSNALITGTLPILAVWFFCMGASISLKATPVVLRKSGVLVVTKVATAALAGVIASHFLPPGGITSGFLTGLSALTVICVMNETNGGLYMALMQQYGTKEEAGAFCLMSLESGPFMTMVTLGIAGLASFPFATLFGALLPFVIGFALGNNLDFAVIVNTGLLGVLIGVCVMIVTGTTLVLADIFLAKGNGTAGVGACSTAGAAVAVPQIIAGIEPRYAAVAPAATALVATSVVVTALLTPIVTSLWARRWGVLSPKYRDAADASPDRLAETQALDAQMERRPLEQ